MTDLPAGLTDVLAALPVREHLNTPGCATGACPVCRANDEATARKTLEYLREHGWTVLAPTSAELARTRPTTELADHDPETGHRHGCADDRAECGCAAALYALADDLEHPRPADPADGPEDGHTFRLRVSSRGSYGVDGEPGHTDAEDFHDEQPFVLEVRAWNLRDACARAAATPFAGWRHPGET